MKNVLLSILALVASLLAWIVWCLFSSWVVSAMEGLLWIICEDRSDDWFAILYHIALTKGCAGLVSVSLPAIIAPSGYRLWVSRIALTSVFVMPLAFYYYYFLPLGVAHHLKVEFYWWEYILPCICGVYGYILVKKLVEEETLMKTLKEQDRSRDTTPKPLS